MITNVEFNNVRKGSIASYAKYCVSPKEQELANHHPVGDERLEAFYCTNMTTIDAQTSLKDKRTWAKQFETDIRAWNEEHKKGRPLTKRGEKKDKAADFESNQCVLGTISFGVSDKVTKEQAMAFAIESIQNVMPGTRQMMVAIHGDGQVMHAHFIVSVVDLETGKAYAPQGEYRAMYNQWELENERMELHYPDILEHVQQREAVAIQERKAALAQGIEGFESTRTTRVTQLSHGTHQKIFKREEGIAQAPEADLRREFLLACDESDHDFEALLDNLEARNIRVFPNMGTEKVGGLSIAFRDELPDKDGKLKTTKLSTYGKDYGWKNLSKDFNYDRDKHNGRLKECRDEADRAAANCRAIATGIDLNSGTNNAVPTSTATLDGLNAIANRADEFSYTSGGPTEGHGETLPGHGKHEGRQPNGVGKGSKQDHTGITRPDPSAGSDGRKQGSITNGNADLDGVRSELPSTDDYRRIRPENDRQPNGIGHGANHTNEDPAQTSSGRSGKPDYSVRSDGANSGIDGGMVDNGTGQTTGIDGTEAGRNRKEGGLLVLGVVGHKPEMANTTAQKIASKAITWAEQNPVRTDNAEEILAMKPTAQVADPLTDYFKTHPTIRAFFAEVQEKPEMLAMVKDMTGEPQGLVMVDTTGGNAVTAQIFDGEETLTVENFVKKNPCCVEFLKEIQSKPEMYQMVKDIMNDRVHGGLKPVDYTQDNPRATGNLWGNSNTYKPDEDEDSNHI